MRVLPTVTASTMIAQVCWRHKVGYHIELWIPRKAHFSQGQREVGQAASSVPLSQTPWTSL